MSYTNMSVTWIPNNRLNETVVDEYGDLNDASVAPITIKARKQPHAEVVHTKEGEVLISKNIYYVDPRVEKFASKIKELDKLDGEIVKVIYIMMGHTKPVMYKFITV